MGKWIIRRDRSHEIDARWFGYRDRRAIDRLNRRHRSVWRFWIGQVRWR